MKITEFVSFSLSLHVLFLLFCVSAACIISDSNPFSFWEVPCQFPKTLKCIVISLPRMVGWLVSLDSLGNLTEIQDSSIHTLALGQKLACIALHFVVSFSVNIHFASMKHAHHTLHMSSRWVCVCSREMYSNTFQWNGYRFTWMEIAIVFWPISCEMRALLEQWHGASLKFASGTHSSGKQSKWEWEQAIGMRTMMHVHRIPSKSTKTEWQKVFTKWETQCTVQP